MSNKKFDVVLARGIVKVHVSGLGGMSYNGRFRTVVVIALHSFPDIKTPCVGVCSTGIGDSVCRGCKRFDYEVINWNGYNQQEKRAIDSRLARLLAQLVDQRLQIVDQEKLFSQMRHQQILFRNYRPASCALYELLKAGASQIKNTLDFGFCCEASYQHLSLPEIREEIERELYALSVAHFERFVLANASRARCVSSAPDANELNPQQVVE